MILSIPRAQRILVVVATLVLFTSGCDSDQRECLNCPSVVESAIPATPLAAVEHGTGGAPAPAAAHSDHAPKVSKSEALERLKAGNARYVDGKLTHPHQDLGRRAELAGGQAPYAVILGCADSRTSPEVLFDQGLGDLFVVRVAGNVVNEDNTGSIEYAVEHLGSRLIVVLGHKACGAVKAARGILAGDGKAPGHLGSLINAIKPAVDATKNDDVEATVKANVKNAVKLLRDSGPVLKAMVDKGDLGVVGGYYDLNTGVVTIYDN